MLDYFWYIFLSCLSLLGISALLPGNTLTTPNAHIKTFPTECCGQCGVEGEPRAILHESKHNHEH
jgi:hypothetical protein